MNESFDEALLEQTNDESTTESSTESSDETVIEHVNDKSNTESSVNDTIIHNSDINEKKNNTTSTGVALTTFDNPYDPFDQFASWFLFDVEKGYNTCSYLARIANISDDMSEEEVDAETERAIDEIIEYDFMNIYKKLTKNITKPE